VVHEALAGYGVVVSVGESDSDYATYEYGRAGAHAYRAYERGLAAITADVLKSLCEELGLGGQLGEITDKIKAKKSWTGP
jgi:hypothetical protein